MGWRPGSRLRGMSPEKKKARRELEGGCSQRAQARVLANSSAISTRLGGYLPLRFYSPANGLVLECTSAATASFM